mmetsp:Transcript_19392/g.38588  ORF Transcript_19392/g.38588 Transcript_19392/m.38588 type:complete len:839 (+) Transcript_19392:143-2659(+)
MLDFDLENDSAAYLEIDDLVIDFDANYDGKHHITEYANFTEDTSDQNYDLGYIEPSNFSEPFNIADDPDIVDFLQDIASEPLGKNESDCGPIAPVTTAGTAPARISSQRVGVLRPVQKYHGSCEDFRKGVAAATVTAPSSPSPPSPDAPTVFRPDSTSSGKYFSTLTKTWRQFQIPPMPHQITLAKNIPPRPSLSVTSSSPPLTGMRKVHKPISSASVLNDDGPEELTDAASKAARRNRIIIQREKRLRQAADAAVKAIQEQGISGVVESTGAVVAIMENLASDLTGLPNIKMDVPPVPMLTPSCPWVPSQAVVIAALPRHSPVTPPPLPPTNVAASLAGFAPDVYPAKPHVIKTVKRAKESAASICGVELPQGDDPDTKRQRRLIRNRLSAQLHRERKRDLIETLRDEVAEKVSEIESLKGQLDELISLNDNYVKAFGMITHSFGEDKIKMALPYNIYNSLQKTWSHIVSNRPGLVSAASSSIGSDSESDYTLTPPASPISDNFPISSVDPSANKKRKRVIPKPSLAALGTMALCLMIGASNTIGPNKGFPRSESGVVPNSSGLSDSSRRLMPVEIDEYDDLDFDVDLDDELFPETGTFTRSCPKCFQPSVPEWKISPLEMYPDRWNYQEGAPWSHERSYEMFNLNNFLEKSKKEPSIKSSVQFKTPSESPQPGVRGGIAGSSEKSLVQYRGGSDEFGRSFMFCPKAHLDLAPGLQELAKLKITSQKEDSISEKKRPLIQVNEVDEAVSILSESRALIPNWDANLESRTSSGAKGTLMGGDDPYMSILVPASSVTGMGFQDLGYENKDAWLEIECQVTSLKLFGGVAFNFDSEADII